MSMNMVGRSVIFVTKVGSRSTFELTIKNNDGTVKDLSNNTQYATGKWKVWQPNGTLLINGNIAYSDRPNGLITYTLGSTDTTSDKVGVWEGEVELKDTDGVISEQTQSFNFIIEESY